MQPASALTVFDPSNFVQNTLTAVRTLEQINNQINQLQNEAQMLMNQARNLANLDFNIVNRLRSTLATTERLIAERAAWPTTCRAWMPRPPVPGTVRRHHQRRPHGTGRPRTLAEHLNGLHTAMRMQAQVSQNLAQDESALADLVSQSQSATGALQAMQATNQLLALQAAVDPGAAAPDHARPGRFTGTGAASGGMERAREVRRRFLGTGTPYTPQSVNFYNN